MRVLTTVSASHAPGDLVRPVSTSTVLAPSLLPHSMSVSHLSPIMMTSP